MNKIKVAYNTIFRKFFLLDYRTLGYNISVSQEMMNLNILNFESILRKCMMSLRTRIISTDNDLLCTIVNSDYFIDNPIHKNWIDSLYIF